MVPGGSVNLSGNVERPVTITGRSDRPLQSVMINQQAAKITEGGLGFVFNNFYLREGNNMLSAVGTDAQGRKTSTSILVNVDQTAPLLSIESPQDQSLISRSKIDIRATVNDAVEGLFQAASLITRLEDFLLEIGLACKAIFQSNATSLY